MALLHCSSKDTFSASLRFEAMAQSTAQAKIFVSSSLAFSSFRADHLTASSWEEISSQHSRTLEPSTWWMVYTARFRSIFSALSK